MNEWNEKERDRLLQKSIDSALSTNLNLNVILITKGCCNECDKLSDMTIPLDEYLKNPILPYNKCTRHTLPNPPYSASFCICTLGFASLRDENGRLIERS